MPSGNPVLQSGNNITPQHLASWTTDGVIQDSGVSFNNTQAFFRSDILNVNFNLTSSDNQILINLPVGFTRWRPSVIFISGASGTLTTATCSVYTQPAAGGFAIVSSGTAITVTNGSIDTNNNMQALSLNDANTMALSDTAIYFRVQNPQGAPATANITVFYEPLP
jgi:hypothetical protein